MRKQWETPELVSITKEEYEARQQADLLCNHAALMSELADQCKDYE
jgi:hypothetical protein